VREAEEVWAQGLERGETVRRVLAADGRDSLSHMKRGPMGIVPGASGCRRRSAGEDSVQPLFDFALVGLGCDRNLLDEEGACGIEHLALTEG